MRVRVRIQFPDGSSTAQEATADSIRLGRDASCEIAFDSVAHPKVSGLHAKIEQTDGTFSLVHLSRSNKTLLNDAEVGSSLPVKVGDRVRLGFTGPMMELLLLEATPKPEPVDPDESGRTLQADARHLALLRGTAGVKRIELGQGGIIGREPGAVQFLLNHPHVSRKHASITVNEGRVLLADLGSPNGTFVNGRRIERPTVLAAGDRIDIGPFSLRFDGTAMVSDSRSNNIELSARRLKRVVTNRATGNPLTLLDGVSLVVRPREFACLLGPSGSGKSTLLAMLSGRNAPDEGAVKVNGADLYSDFDALKGDIAVVPQKDVLHNSLAVGAALSYTAELRLPPDMSSDEVEISVSDILEVVGLTNRRDTLIRHLSGGQVKRASLANELVSRPSLLFLDEVTSGLDEQTDREVMELFRQVADGGKTVVCITHSLANVETTCHLVVILTEGGRLAFFGTPAEAKAYFGIERLGDVYRKLAELKPSEWHQRFKSSVHYRRYVVERMKGEVADDERTATATGEATHRGASALRQTSVLTRRYLSIVRGDVQALLAMLGQCLLIAVLLGLVFRNLNDVADPSLRQMRSVNLLLLLAVSCFWFGCNTAAKELVKERLIFRRERDFNLRAGSYLASKFLVLAAISVVQAVLLFGIVAAWCRLPGTTAAQCITLSALAVAGTSIGLLISALARSEDVASAMVPIVVIPQIILAGVIAPVSGVAQLLGKSFATVYWAQQALEKSLNAIVQSSTGESTVDWTGPFVVVLAHIAIPVALTFMVLSWVDVKEQ